MKNTIQKKKVNACLRSKLAFPNDLEAAFFLSANDNVLIDQINEGDESALMQFSFKHLPILTCWVIRKRPNDASLHALTDFLMPYFLETIKCWAKEYAGRKLTNDWYRDLRKKLDRVFCDATCKVFKKELHSVTRLELNAHHLYFLNRLNDFLITVEQNIVTEAKKRLPPLENNYQNPDSLTSDYEYFVEISYFSTASNGDPVYTAEHRLHFSNVAENDWGLLCDGEDWREHGGWIPELDRPCCYLMHELAYHSKLYAQLFEINTIWVDTKTWDQAMYKLNKGWKFKQF